MKSKHDDSLDGHTAPMAKRPRINIPKERHINDIEAFSGAPHFELIRPGKRIVIPSVLVTFEQGITELFPFLAACRMLNCSVTFKKERINYTEPQRGLLARLFHSDAQIHRRGTEKCRCMQALPRQCRKNGAYRRAVRRLGERLIRFGSDLSDNPIWSIIHFPAENLPIMYTHTPDGTKLPDPNISSVLQKAGC